MKAVPKLTQWPTMHRRQLLAALLFAALAALATPVAYRTAAATQLHGVIVGITDGDTVTLLDDDHRQHKIRLAGIDAPESHQDFGTRSRESLARMVFSRRVAVEARATDRYGRTIGMIRVGSINANLEQVRAGMAWHYKAYARDQPPQERDEFSMAEDVARAARKGLWSAPSPKEPWLWRKDAKNERTVH